MKKEEFIRRYGIDAFEKMRQQTHDWGTEHPEKIKAYGREISRKGGKYYDKQCKYKSTGIPHERKLIRAKDGQRYRLYKQIIAPESALHHEWIPNSADFRGVALVETDQHQHGYIDVIQILEGKITLFSEEEMRRG